VCNGCYIYEPFDGSFAQPPWLTEVSNAFGSAGAGSISFVPDGFQNQAVRDFIPAGTYDGSSRQLAGQYLGNGSPYVHTGPGETTWYRIHFRFEGSYVPAQSDSRWLEVWHNNSTIVPGVNSLAWGIYADGTTGGVGTNPRFLLRPGGGCSCAPVYHHYYAAPGSFQIGHWYDIVTEITWGTSTSTGSISAWIDGQPFVASASNGPSGESFSNGQGVATLYQNSSGQYDDPALSLVNYDWRVPVDFDEVLTGPTAASIGFTP
jgi:hypothetical protein